MTQDEFDVNYADALENILVGLAQHSDIDPQKFFHLACVIENLRFFSPVLYGAIQQAKEESPSE
ncbi:hypothetical protein [Nibribacter ruber]|nr:hypothetical protein [Nibribacter ruber]